MKIPITEREFYSIELPDEITSCDELAGIIERLRNILPLIKKNMVANSEITSPFKTHKEHKLTADEYKIFFKHINKNRGYALKLLQFYYHDSRENKDVLSNKMGIDWKTIQARTWSVRKAHSITANEVGLIRFPIQKETHSIEDLRDKDFIYDKNIFNDLLSLCSEVKI